MKTLLVLLLTLILTSCTSMPTKASSYVGAAVSYVGVYHHNMSYPIGYYKNPPKYRKYTPNKGKVRKSRKYYSPRIIKRKLYKRGN